MNKPSLVYSKTEGNYCYSPRMKEQAVHLPVLDLRTGLPLRSTVPSLVYSPLPSSLPLSSATSINMANRDKAWRDY